MSGWQALLARNAPAPAPAFGGFPRYNFVGGHNDPEAVPVDELARTAERVIREQGRLLATYNLDAGALGHLGLRSFVADKLRMQRGIPATAEDVLITSGSLQGLDLVNALLLEPGDTVLVEQLTYGGMLTRLQRAGVRVVGVPLDDEGLSTDALETICRDLQTKGVRPKYLYTVPTVQNPTGTVLPVERRRALVDLADRYGFLLFEDECYADLLWEGSWPPALAGFDTEAPDIHIGSFSKSLAPALRLGYIHAPPELLARLVALKTDGGTPAIEQMIVADYFDRCFEPHVKALKERLARKAGVLMEALDREFGTAAAFTAPKGGIFLWVRLPDVVDTSALAGPALAEGVAFNPGAEWSTDRDVARSCLRLCYALPPEDVLREGVAKLAEVCHRETGVPALGANRRRGEAS